jgi:hypothetical protein
MEIAALATNQAIKQSQVGLSMIKQAAKMDQAIVDLVSQSADRGKNLNITV